MNFFNENLKYEANDDTTIHWNSFKKNIFA